MQIYLIISIILNLLFLFFLIFFSRSELMMMILSIYYIKSREYSFKEKILHNLYFLCNHFSGLFQDANYHFDYIEYRMEDYLEDLQDAIEGYYRGD